MKKSCDKVSHLVSDALERRLSWGERIEVALHLSMCRLCKDYAYNVRALHDMCTYMRHSDAARGVKLSSLQRRKLKAALNNLNSCTE